MIAHESISSAAVSISSGNSTSPPNNDSSKDSEDKQKQKEEDKPTSKSETNPLMEATSRASWMYFFKNVANKQTVEKGTEKKMITDGSEQQGTTITTTSVNDQKIIVADSSSISSLDKKTETVVTTTTPTPPSPNLQIKPVPRNKILPSFEEFSRFRSNKKPNAFIQQTLHTINSYFFPPDKAPESGLPKILDELTRSSIDVKKIAIIGVHGWFPTKFVRSLVGEPTGTSPKFCDMMGKAVVGYLARHGINLPDDAVTLIPLEGEGKIDTRVDILFTNLLVNQSWCAALAAADVIFVATHSQGTPVSTMLLSRLISLNHIHPRRQRICLLAMAGISHGPFPYLKSTWVVKYFESDPARELFEFMNSDSLVGKKYREALRIITAHGVKVVYVASMDDQVVPLYSAVFTGVSHPSILRAVYIDGPIYRDNDFLTNLIVFAVRLRNAGIHDHDLLVHLSEVVAGSLTGEGHSALYEEIDVYTLAVRYLFESITPTNGITVRQKTFQAQKSYNPYYLPWAMRGILDDKYVGNSECFTRELYRLRKQYDEWEPISRTMKDIKFRLEPLREAVSRSKL
ncbi:1500_t:CDS:2 [Ambispora gerdemannii]|uniref:1500_t:CDS:1 n=1 Tax=Ambispora gerdemannii TaxID=144530 RepID=A0A9N8V2D7_9GLOM|nr:1500_t:CDS:2 [Ambispora gerdemannii]